MNQHKFAFRVGVLVLLIAVMAGVFSVRLHNVQITQAAEQDPTPSGSVTYHTRVTAARGEILDRNGNVLVGNRASYNLVIVREVLMSADAPNENLRRLVDLCSELGLEYTDHFPVTQEKPYAYVVPLGRLFPHLPHRARLGYGRLRPAAHPLAQGDLPPARRLDGGGVPPCDLAAL